MPSAVTHVLLMPEDIIGGPPSQTPVYGTIVVNSGTTTTVELLSAPHTTVQVPRSIASARHVEEAEYDEGAAGEWLRKPVVGVTDGIYVYGQAIAYSGETITIRTSAGERISSLDDLTEIAPVLCFLLGSNTRRVDDLSQDELADQHNDILDKLIGDNGQATTRSIPRLLQGVVPTRQQPRPADTMLWTNAATGIESTVSIRHAVDFTYYIDGSRRAPPSVRDNIGDSFDNDPRYTRESSVRQDEEDAQDDADLDAILNSMVQNNDRPPTPAQNRRPTSQPATDGDSHTKVLAAIADNPDLIRFYLSMCQSSGSKRQANSLQGPEPRRRRLDAPSEVFEASENGNRRSKHAFSPSQTQQVINGLLVAQEHAGKEPAALVDAMISSRASKFKPHPAIIARLYAFEFGARGLTIMHFVRFDFAARRSWYADGSVNLNNFGPAIALPKAPRPKSLDDISNALTVLHVFADEFMDKITCRLLSYAREFVEELRSFCQWSAQDVETLTFWFDSVLEDYRSATDFDARNGATSRANIHKKLSLQDPDLQSVLYVIQSERLATLTATPARPFTSRAAPVRIDTPQREDSTRITRKTPENVLMALPRQGRLSVCMKYLSSRGCASKSDERCAFPNHAHFIPESLDPVVRDHIIKRLGGLRPELLQ